jgi:hypothetical protein
MTAVAATCLAGRSLVAEELFERLTRRVITDEGHEPTFAVRVLDQALAFLGTCAVNHAESLSPSRMVDYREFRERVAGRFIDSSLRRAQVDDPACVG